MTGFGVIAQAADCSALGTDTERFSCNIGKIVDILAFLSIPVAVGSVVVIGLILIGGITHSNGSLAAHTIKRFVLVAIGLNILFNAHHIARLVEI